MSEPTTHDLTMARYTQEWEPPSNAPNGPPDPPLADLQACMSSDPQPALAPVTLADALKRLVDAREHLAHAADALTAVAANLAGHG
jgi:hypothetical protein